MKDIQVTTLTTKDRIKQVEEQFRTWEVIDRKAAEKKSRKGVRFITISREYGCAGFRIGERLAAELNAKQQDDSAPWTVYDRKLIDLVCSSHKLNQILVETLDRQRKHLFSDYITGLFTGEPSSMKVFRKCAETIFQLAAHGRVIIIGRASALITSKLSGGLHVRVIAPLQWRVKQVAAYEKIESLDEARRYVMKMDRERGKFAKDFLGKSLKDPTNYDLIVNQQRLGIESIVKLILQIMELREEEQ